MPSGSASRLGSPTSSCSCARCCSWPLSFPPGKAASMTSLGCIPLWVGARGIEFDWKYIQMSIDSNISLVHYIIASAQVWMITRYDLYHTFRPAVLLLMFLSVYKAFVMETFVHLCSLGSWTALLARAVVTGLLALSTLALYVAVVNVHS
uniref:BOS complex subunit TMEM147 n=1 Tax=Pipistrellus kuhlii TaxID=59472 RepID=A0A7J7V1M1_PIPKU|nr:transmembrane protein 147 [Pipistrellus kuhlii]